MLEDTSTPQKLEPLSHANIRRLLAAFRESSAPANDRRVIKFKAPPTLKVLDVVMYEVRGQDWAGYPIGGGYVC